MKVPLLDLAAQHEPLRGEILAAIERVLDSQRFILGPEVARLEEQIAAYCGTRHAIGVSSGTDALLAALMALGIGRGDEVVTTAYSFFATAGVIARLGARAVFVDIDAATYNIDPAGIERALTLHTKAIIPVHLFGQCADMDPIVEVARRHNVAIIEDAAQAIGAQYGDGRGAGSIGDLGCFSFFPSKNLGALGDGGMVTTNSAELADKVRILRVHGGKPKYYHHVIGGNFRLDEIQAAVLNVKFKYLDQWSSRRRANARNYVDLFRKGRLDESSAVGLPVSSYEKSGCLRPHIYNQFVIRVPGRRDGLMQYLKEKAGIHTEVYYPLPLHRQPCFADLAYQDGTLPEAERAARETLALPIYPELPEGAQKYIVDSVREYLLAAS